MTAGLAIPPAPDDDDEGEGEEGAILSRIHRYRERDRKLVATKKNDVLKKTGALKCESCSFEFGQTYGKRGEGFIEVHHTKPLYTLGPKSTTKLEDLAVLCANCHRMVHAERPWLDMQALKALVHKGASK